MDDAATLADALEALHARVAKKFPALGPLFSRTPTDPAPLADSLRLAGFPLPPSYRAALEIGAVSLPSIRSLQLGVLPCDAEELFDNHLHHLAEQNAEVADGGAWMVFATEHGDVEPAWAFDRRFVERGEFAVGWYHQDDVCHTNYASTLLPRSEPSYAAFFLREIERFRVALRDRPDEFARHEEELLSHAPRAPRSWRSIWERRRALDRWDHYAWPDLRYVLRETDDHEVVEAIASRVERDLRGIGERVVPGLSQDRASGYWTTGLPGPVDLAARLPDPQRRDLLRWALRHSGVEPSTDATQRAWDELARRAHGDDGEDPAVRHASADEGWRRWRLDEVTPADRFARALAWALGPLTPARMAHVLAASHALRVAIVGDQRLSMQRIWGRLRRLLAGTPVPEAIVPPARTALEHELATWSSTFEGSQREKLAALEREWLPRLRTLPPETRAGVSKIVRKAISSKKLRDARDALIAQLVDGARDG